MTPAAAIPPIFSHCQLLTRLTTHLDMLAGQVFELERTLGGTLAHDVQMSDVAITQLQGLDFLRQSLEDLAMMTATIARAGSAGNEPVGGRADALQKLKLSSTKALLEPTGGPDMAPEISDGKLDLF